MVTFVVVLIAALVFWAAVILGLAYVVVRRGLDIKRALARVRRSLPDARPAPPTVASPLEVVMTVAREVGRSLGESSRRRAGRAHRPS